MNSTAQALLSILAIGLSLATAGCADEAPTAKATVVDSTPSRYEAPHLWPPSDLLPVDPQPKWAWATEPDWGFEALFESYAPDHPMFDGLTNCFDEDPKQYPELPNSEDSPARLKDSSWWPWYAALDLGQSNTPEEFADFWSKTEIDPSFGRRQDDSTDSGLPQDLKITLGSEKGSVFTIIQNRDAGQYPMSLEISAVLTARGEAPTGTALATLSAIEITGLEELPSYEELPARMGAQWSIGQVTAPSPGAIPGDEPSVSVHAREVVRLNADSRGLALAFGAKHAGTPGVSFELTSLRVDWTDARGIVRSLKSKGTELPEGTKPWDWRGWRFESPTRYQLDWTSRFGWAVAPGIAMRSVVEWPAGTRKARLWTGLLAHPSTDPSAEVSLRIEVQRAGLDEVTETTVDLGPEHYDRWIPVEIDIGEAEDFDEQAAVTVSCVPRGETSWWAVPIVAGLRATDVQAQTDEASNLLLVSLDTLRADHVGGYGYERDTTPRLDDFARQALRFTNVWSTSAYTLPAHLSMLSGQLPSLHGVERPEQRRSPLTTPLLAEQLAAEGYATAAFTGGAMLLPDFGFASGFERYGILDPSITPEAEEVIERLLPVPGFDRETVERHGLQPALDWVDVHRGEPWFLFVHTYAAHEFEPPPRFLRDLGLDGSIERDEEAMAFLGNQQMPDERARRYLIDRYDGGVRAADEMVGRLLDHLDDRGLRDDTVILVTSDHGKEIGDRNQVRHGHSLQEEMVHVPLWLSAPGLKPGVIDSPKSLIDVAPTLIELLGLPPWPSAAGPEVLQPRSLLERGNPRRELWAELDNQGVTRAWRRGSRKTIHNPDRPGSIEITPGPEWQGYDLDEDPFESNPLEVPADRRATLEALYGELRQAGQREDDGVNLGTQQKALLEALGYTVDGAGN